MGRHGVFAVDADGHVFEPEDTWDRYMTGPPRERRPRYVRDNQGKLRALLEGRLYMTPEGPGIGNIGGWDAARVRPGGSDPHARLRDMDEEGLDVAVLFPGVAMGFQGIRDRDLAAACCRAYNDWVHDYARADPRRLRPVAVVPLQDPQAAAAEARRMVKNGFVGIMVGPWVGQEAKQLGHPDHDPFYAEAQELGVPVCPHACTACNLPYPGLEWFDRFFHTHMISHPFAQQMASVSLVCGGVLERFPRLKVLFCEAGCGWFPWWVERMDEHYEHLPKEERCGLTMKPSEYVERQCWVTCEPGESGLAAAVGLIGEDKIMIASDYPHWDMEFGGSVVNVMRRPDLTRPAKEKVVGQNAARLFGV
jgi:predicted TIM-barrel fold metal-dependent hydrolase